MECEGRGVVGARACQQKLRKYIRGLKKGKECVLLKGAVGKRR